MSHSGALLRFFLPKSTLQWKEQCSLANEIKNRSWRKKVSVNFRRRPISRASPRISGHFVAFGSGKNNDDVRGGGNPDSFGEEEKKLEDLLFRSLQNKVCGMDRVSFCLFFFRLHTKLGLCVCHRRFSLPLSKSLKCRSIIFSVRDHFCQENLLFSLSALCPGRLPLFLECAKRPPQGISHFFSFSQVA